MTIRFDPKIHTADDIANIERINDADRTLRDAKRVLQEAHGEHRRLQRHHEVFLEMLKQIVYVAAPMQHRDPLKQVDLVRYAREVADLAYPPPKASDGKA